VVCVGRREQIEHLLGTGTLEALFFGYAEYTDDQDGRFLGVWGARNASRLRRLLREQGAEVTVHHAPPPARLRIWQSCAGARVASKRIHTVA